MNHVVTIFYTEDPYGEIEFSEISGKKKLKVEFDLTITRDEGIGSYEFWGHRSSDNGTGQLFVDEVTYDPTDFTEQERSIIDTYLESTVWDRVQDKLLKQSQEYF